MRSASALQRPYNADHASQHRGSLVWALIATSLVVLVPSAIVSATVRVSGSTPNMFVTWTATALLSLAMLAAGTGWWMRQQGSTTMSFGELMLWRWARRKKADELVVRGSQAFTLAATDVETTRRGQLKLLHDLNEALETRDPYTRGHARRVERHCYRTALSMHRSLEDIFNLRLAASLHDVGKIEVPIEIIRKQGPLDDGEWAVMKTHSAVGAEMIGRIGNDDLVSAVRHHHERWDGSGYPDKISGTDIPLHARIIAVCDTFDAITSTRSYRKKSARKEAIRVIKEQSGRQFDPEVVEAFLAGLPRPLPGVAALSSLSLPLLRRLIGQVGLVVKQAGAVGVVGAVAATGVSGVVATTAISPAKYLNGRTAQQAEVRTAQAAEVPVTQEIAAPGLAGAQSVPAEVKPRLIAKRESSNAADSAARERTHGKHQHPEGKEAPANSSTSPTKPAKPEKQRPEHDQPAVAGASKPIEAPGQAKKSADEVIDEVEDEVEVVEDEVDDMPPGNAYGLEKDKGKPK